jgi:hypothetical protein
MGLNTTVSLGTAWVVSSPALVGRVPQAGTCPHYPLLNLSLKCSILHGTRASQQHVFGLPLQPKVNLSFLPSQRPVSVSPLIRPFQLQHGIPQWGNRPAPQRNTKCNRNHNEDCQMRLPKNARSSVTRRRGATTDRPAAFPELPTQTKSACCWKS